MSLHRATRLGVLAVLPVILAMAGCTNQNIRGCTTDLECRAGEVCAGIPQLPVGTCQPGPMISPMIDAGTPAPDAGPPPADAGFPDAGPPADAGFPDAGTQDAGPTLGESEGVNEHTNNDTSTAELIKTAVDWAGTIGNVVGGDFDFDVFKFNVNTGDVLKVTLTAPAGSQLQPTFFLTDDVAYARQAIPIGAETSISREMYVTFSGEMFLFVDDVRNLAQTPANVGGADHNYILKVEKLATPIASEITLPLNNANANISGNAIQIYSFGVNNGDKVTAETIADRLGTPSQVDTILILMDSLTGTPMVLGENDDIDGTTFDSKIEVNSMATDSSVFLILDFFRIDGSDTRVQLNVMASSSVDGGPPEDGGTPDAGTPDAGTPDAGTPDAGSPAGSAQIMAVRDAADMPPDASLSLSVENVLVTYVRKAIGDDPAGFFVQAETKGPALFVAVDPSTITPNPPEVGDNVTFTVTATVVQDSQRRATAISGYVRNSTGNSIDSLLQDIHTLDFDFVDTASTTLETVNSIESEIIRGGVIVNGSFFGAGTDHAQADITTDTETATNSNFRLRVTTAIRDALGLTDTCRLEFKAAPVWRFQDRIQPSIWNRSDIDLVKSDCPATVVTNAAAASLTQVRITFDREIDESSLMTGSLSGQFQIVPAGGGAMLNVTGYSVDGNTLVLTTDTQGAGTEYEITVTNGVKDVFGKEIDSNANTFTFFGFVPPAQVRINELNANIAHSNGCDLVELRVISGGSMDGFQLWEREDSVITFTGLMVNTNDYIVVHFDSGDSACVPNMVDCFDETDNKNEASSCTVGFSNAWDWFSTDTGLTRTDNVITLFDNVGAIIDAVFVSDNVSGTAASATERQAATVAAAGQWTMPDGGLPENGFVDGDFNANAAQDLDGTSTDNPPVCGDGGTSTSIQRLNNSDTNTKDDWTMDICSFGSNNTGQTDF